MFTWQQRPCKPRISGMMSLEDVVCQPSVTGSVLCCTQLLTRGLRSCDQFPPDAQWAQSRNYSPTCCDMPWIMCSLFRCCSEDISWLFNNSFISQMLFLDRPKCKDYFLMERNMFYGCSVVMPWAVLLFFVCVCVYVMRYLYTRIIWFIVFSFLSVIFSHRAFAKPVSVNKEVFYNATHCHSQ